VSKIRKKEGNKIVSKNTFSVKNMPHEKVCQWVDGALEKLGLYISDNFIDLQSFFKKFASEEDKMRFEDFYKFVKSNMKCFEGLNLTKDEYLTLFSSIDPHKKSYLKQADLKNKLEIYNFSDKIHKEIKEFIKASFKSNVDGFKYFMDSGKSDNVNKLTKSHTTHIKFTLIEKGIPLRQALNYERENKKDYLTQKEMFNGLNRLFPGKYSTNQILMYINSKFKNPEKIEFNEFSYLFYDTIQRNSTAPNDSFKERTQRALSTKVRLCTPFDHDPMEKLRRILKSSKFDCTEIMEFCNNSTEGLLNENELRNILKKINMGLTNLEIDVIIKRVGKTLDGKINVKEFMKLSSAV
jgi:Ca2+-binding EF-hand superfamily protein